MPMRMQAPGSGRLMKFRNDPPSPPRRGGHYPDPGVFYDVKRKETHAEYFMVPRHDVYHS